ncbi:recombinase family protein [Streptomyces sp. NPDC048106]|uniref:recombinase family protein n=1 Tax=Streptomyces sp. NPDC048106 TaxID=3155750 RepID=UPI003456C24E
MSERVSYSGCGPGKQDHTSQREILLNLDVPADRIYLEHRLTGTNRDRPSLAQTLAAVRAGDTLVVPTLGRLARSVPDVRDIGDSLNAREVTLSLVCRVLEHHPNAAAPSNSGGQ